MDENLIGLLHRLSETPGPPGQEQQVRDLIVEELKAFSQELTEDSLGNLIAKTGADDGYRIGILAHMDEVGFIVSGISDKGLIDFEMAGNIDPRSLLAREVDIVNTEGKLVRGIIGNESRHLQTGENSSVQLSHNQLSIDIGVNSFDEVLGQGITVGCGIVFATRFHRYPYGAVLGKALDNRIGCAVLVEALKSVGSSLRNTTVYGMFTIQEEIGAKGAGVVAFDILPQMTITLDSVPTKNPEKINARDTDLNHGPVIRLFDWHTSTKKGMFTHPNIRNRLLEVARKEKIPHQVDVLTRTYLDSSQAHLTAGGIPGGSICFPRRYSHSPVELSHMDDIENGLNLLVAFIKSLDENPIMFGRNYK